MFYGINFFIWGCRGGGGGGGVADLGEGDHNYAPSRSTCDCEQEIDLYEKELT